MWTGHVYMAFVILAHLLVGPPVPHELLCARGAVAVGTSPPVGTCCVARTLRGCVTLPGMFAYVHLYAVTVNQYLLNDLVSAFSCSSPSVSQCACIPVVKLARCFSPPVPHFSVFVHLILHCPCCTVSDCYCVDYVFRSCSMTWGSGFIAKRP